MLGWKYDYGPFLIGPRVGFPPALTRGRSGKLFSPFPRIRTLTATSVNPVPAIGASVVQFRCAVTLRELCQGHVPEPVLRRMDENGFIQPTEVQQQGLPVLFTGCDCVLHAQTGSGKTLTYLLLVYSIINAQRSAVQALIVVPTRELGMQVTKVARMLAAKPSDFGSEQQKSCTVMALLDGGLLKRHKTWLKADPPSIVVATVASLCQMLEKHVLDLGSMRVLVIDEICPRTQRFQAILSLLQFDLPESAILFVNEQSEKSKKAGDIPTTTLLIEHLKSSCDEFSNISLLEEDQNFNSRAASLLEVRKKNCYLIVATDLAARGVDLPETTHIYNFDLPKSAVHYLHRAGRAGRKPFSDDKCIVTSIIAPEEYFVLQRFEHELKFHCEEFFL
ncbi:DEAD-box ATP-dependent RNA helicase 58, chloroplastic-like isoform X4 [Chenopodium quinoa]|uniref:DEAD-box ATP-dependent RNA helicase 58, chloroplastic-like isoform X4 n=1 Tax=Chenopodium quinoa TaxID=63459 RepID=UPI000B78BE36|nr:DEAD-box ATP-dependent RNA helicase 58, chloroplastic-like isoform X4 [Chenopodium quinoa]